MQFDREEDIYQIGQVLWQTYTPHILIKGLAFVPDLFNSLWFYIHEIMPITKETETHSESAGNQDYQKTEIIGITSETEVGTTSRKAENAHAHSKETSRSSRSTQIFKRKSLTLAVLLFFLFLSLVIFYRHQLLNHYMDSIQISKLLTSAENSVAKNRILSPNEDCGYYYYQEILKIDRHNEKAKTGLQKILPAIILRAEKEIQLLNFPSARHYIEIGLGIHSANIKLLSLQTKASKTNELLEFAEKCMTEKQIISPEGDCGYYYFQEILKIACLNYNIAQALTKSPISLNLCLKGNMILKKNK